MLDVLDAVAVRRWYRRGLEALGLARAEIDALNVYPVPDGDTGTNMFLTMESAVQAAAGRGDMETTARQMAHGALLGARGNSGVILSQLLRGIAEVLGSQQTPPDAAIVAAALHRAVELAYASVGNPVEGTMLTVAREAAEAATRRAEGGDAELFAVVQAAAAAAREALIRTPEQLEVLARAGVVDAGGRGVTVLLDALEEIVAERVGHGPRSELRTSGIGGSDHRAMPSAAAAQPRGPVEMTGPEYEVMYLLEADDEAVAELRTHLAALGDSLAVSGGAGLWNVHVHVDDPGAAVEAGLAAGRAYRIRVTHLAAADPHDAYHRPDAGGRAVVAVAPGEGLATLFAEAGATVVMGWPGHQPSTADLLAGVRRAGASQVVLLPNDARVQAVAQAAAAQGRHEGIEVVVIETQASVQVLAALAVHDPSAPFADDVRAMTDAALGTRWGLVTTATRASMTGIGACEAGDALGLLADDVVVIGSDLSDVARRLLDLMIADGVELITVIAGADAGPELTGHLVEHLHRVVPLAQTSVYDGGQPGYPLLVGVE